MSVDLSQRRTHLDILAGGAAGCDEGLSVGQVVDRSQLFNAGHALIFVRIVVAGELRDARDGAVQLLFLGSAVRDVSVCLRVQELEAGDVLAFVLQDVIVDLLAIVRDDERAESFGPFMPPFVDLLHAGDAFRVLPEEDGVRVAVEEILVADGLDRFHELVPGEGRGVDTDGVGHEVVHVLRVVVFLQLLRDGLVVQRLYIPFS